MHFIHCGRHLPITFSFIQLSANIDLWAHERNIWHSCTFSLPISIAPYCRLWVVTARRQARIFSHYQFLLLKFLSLGAKTENNIWASVSVEPHTSLCIMHIVEAQSEHLSKRYLSLKCVEPYGAQSELTENNDKYLYLFVRLCSRKFARRNNGKVGPMQWS